MRILFEIDKKDYNINGTSYIRPSARGIIIRNDRLAMVHSLKYDYYKFPGGGIKENENNIDALIREVLEETGLTVIPETIKEYGMVHRIQKGIHEDMFIQDNYYYLCKTDETIKNQKLDDYEEDERFTLEYITPEQAVNTNNACINTDINKVMLQRENKVIEILLQEGLL